GYFDDIDKFASAADQWSGNAPGIYFMLNAVNPDLLARAHNRWEPYARETTSDSDIIRRDWLPLDFDPKRPAGISSTDAEHTAALTRARECFNWLIDFGFQRDSLLLADSGNGGHVLVHIDLPNEDSSTDLVKRCIEAVAFRFSDETVAVDLSVYNAARIWKVYGTLARKGDSTSDRPHRTARILEAPDSFTLASPTLLAELAASAPEEPKSHARQAYKGKGGFDLPSWIDAHSLDVRGPSLWKQD